MSVWTRFPWFSQGKKTGLYERFTGHPSDVEVFDRTPYRIMRFVNQQKLVQGKRHFHDPWDFGLEYLRQHLLAALIAASPQRVLVLGLGVGALPRLIAKCMPNTLITVIEHNSAVVEAATKHFEFSTSNTMQVHVQDALEWCRHHEDSKFDLIFNDCFDGLAGSVPTRKAGHLKTLHAMLSANGVLVTNTLRSECRAPKDLYRDLGEGKSALVWTAPRKSNLTIIYSALPICWSEIKLRAQRVDREHDLPFSLSDEAQRLFQST